MSKGGWIALNLVVDGLAYNAAILLTFVVRFGWPLPPKNLAAYETIVIPLTLGQLLIFFLVGLYDPAAERSGPELLGTVLKGLLLGSVALVALGFLMRAFAFPRSVVLMALVTSSLFVWGWRHAAARFLHVQWPERRVILVGSGAEADIVMERLERFRRWGYRVVAAVDEGFEELPEMVSELEPDQVIVTTPESHRSILEDIASSSRFRGEVLVLPQLYEIHLGELSFGLIQDLPLIRLTAPAGPAWQGGLKMSVERVVAALLLLLLSPILAASVFAVLVFSGRPAFYRQVRVGKDGNHFSVVKFRTMVPDAERDGPVLAVSGDDRVTGIGAFLRRSRLDELPQVWNVLRGEMSFVGPRPERPEFVEEFAGKDPLYMERLQVRPGITGLAQVSGHYATTPLMKIRFDLMYVYHRSLALDLSILLRTVQVVLTGKGAV